MDVTGTTINSWADKSGNARTLTPTSMVTDTARFGGIPVPRMQAGARFTLSGPPNPETAFFAFAQDAITTSASPVTLLAGTTTNAFGRMIATGAGYASLSGEAIIFTSNAEARGVSNAALPGGLSAGEHILSTGIASGRLEIMLDGSADITDIGTVTGATLSWSGQTQLVIGEALTTAAGHIAEAIIYETTLSSSDVDRVTGYLAHKWGLAGSLPVDHPYKTNAPTL